MKAYRKKIWRFVFENFTTLYIQLVTLFTIEYKIPGSRSVLVEKIKQEREIIIDLFGEHVSSQVLKAETKKLENLENALVYPTH